MDTAMIAIIIGVPLAAVLLAVTLLTLLDKPRAAEAERALAEKGLAEADQHGNSVINGLPVKMDVGRLRRRSSGDPAYSCLITFAVRNPLGTRVLLSRENLFNRPIFETLPPALPELQAWLGEAGFTLRADPPGWMAANLALLENFKPFSGGDTVLIWLTVKDGNFEAYFHDASPLFWNDKEKQKALLAASAAAAACFERG